MHHKPELITRRDLIRLTLVSPLAVALLPAFSGAQTRVTKLNKRVFLESPFKIIPTDEAGPIDKLRLTREWLGSFCRSRIANTGSQSVKVKEIVLFDIPHSIPNQTRLYGEGFQMLSQTGGTIGNPKDLGSHTDIKHYKMPIPADTRAFYGMMTLASEDGNNDLLAFTSCRRFNGGFYLRDGSLQGFLDTESQELRPGESWDLEEFTYIAGKDRGKLLDSLAGRLAVNHRPLPSPAPPAGWCSWYCFGPRVTAQQVLDNLDFIAKNEPNLKYIQIDDGYQPAMGDWLETGKAFGGNIQGVLKKIRERGFQPAIWVAPFIAEESSTLFNEHPDWFIKDAAGKPLRSDKVTFGGWRSIKEKGGWYALDGTHPAAQKHLESVFRTMRNEWGVTYFKLDANFWGAMHGGRFYDPRATRIEAYRRGMRSVITGAGDAFILGCNHPIWASMGLIHGSRSSNDIKRTWDRVRSTALQNLNRNWQNGRLWWNDPDAVCLMGELPDNEFEFHATAIYASGGMVLSGDDLTKISGERMAMLKKLLPPQPVAATFADDAFRVGNIERNGVRTVCVFNWEDTPQTFSIHLPRSTQINDFWSGEDLGTHRGTYLVKELPAHSAKLLVSK
ncbi:MAG: glycoside hydrolase family 36 protein [Pyrinomonadaceae bacterium]